MYMSDGLCIFDPAYWQWGGSNSLPSSQSATESIIKRTWYAWQESKP